MDAAPLIDPQCTDLEINDGHVIHDRSHDVYRDIPPDQEGWRALGESIGGHQNLQKLEFHDINSTPENMEALLMGVSHNRSVRKLELSRFHDNWSLENFLATFLENNRHLSSLAVWLYSNPSLCDESVRSLSTVFESCAACSLEEIIWNWSQIGDAIISELIASLAGLSRLQQLDLRFNNIGRMGCDAVAALLRNPSCMLQMIDLSDNALGDEGLAALESAVAMNSTLKQLKLRDIGDITPTVWISFFASILRSPTCILEELNLDQNIIDDDAMVAFADALSSNSTLKTIWFGQLGQHSTITNIGWAAISRALFDESSIINMYHCNHSLSCIYVYEPMMLPSDIRSYLELNEDNGKSAVARQKILAHFFRDDFDMEPFNENNMDYKVLPHLLSWIGRAADWRSYTALYADEEDVSYSDATEEDASEEDASEEEASYSVATEEDVMETSFTAFFGFLRRVPVLCKNCGVEAQHQEAEG